MFYPKPGIIEAGDILDKEGIVNLEGLINKIVCGDALEVLKAIPSDTIDLVITSSSFIKLNRKFIGIEINPQYCIYASERLSKIYQC